LSCTKKICHHLSLSLSLSLSVFHSRVEQKKVNVPRQSIPKNIPTHSHTLTHTDRRKSFALDLNVYRYTLSPSHTERRHGNNRGLLYFAAVCDAAESAAAGCRGLHFPSVKSFTRHQQNF